MVFFHRKKKKNYYFAVKYVYKKFNCIIVWLNLFYLAQNDYLYRGQILKLLCFCSKISWDIIIWLIRLFHFLLQFLWKN